MHISSKMHFLNDKSLIYLLIKKKKKKKPKPKTKQNKNTINTDKDSTLAQKNGPKDWQVTISHLPS